MPESRPPTYDPNGNWQLPGPNGIPHAGTYGGGGGSGGRFSYEVETLRELAHEWDSLAREFSNDLAHSDIIARTSGPGLEYASGGNAEMVRNSGTALHETLLARKRYCEEMAAKFVAALGKYAAAEDAHATEMKHTGGSL